MNSARKDESQNATIYIKICLFCFSMCISNLDLKFLAVVGTFLVNIHICFQIFMRHSKLMFLKWYHVFEILPVFRVHRGSDLQCWCNTRGLREIISCRRGYKSSKFCDVAAHVRAEDVGAVAPDLKGVCLVRLSPIVDGVPLLMGFSAWVFT